MPRSTRKHSVSPNKDTALTKEERQLIARLRRGNKGAFDELVNQHHGVLVRMAMGHVADREIAEEVVQDTWLAVIESLDRFEGPSTLRTSIFGILIHKAKDRGVHEKRHTTFSAFESYTGETPITGSSRVKHRPSRSLTSGLTFHNVTVTDRTSEYLDDRLPIMTNVRVGLHLASCADCSAYLKQIALVLDAVPMLPNQLPSPIIRLRLRQYFSFCHAPSR